MKSARAWSVLAAWVMTMGSAQGSGMLIPKDGSIPPLAIQHQRVDIRIKDGVATARIEQVFKNSVNRDLEAVYIFPLPVNAAIADFAMIINGKRMSGELVEKGRARKIYEDIVRRMKDPGLLEHMGGDLFRVSVYPVPKGGEQKIELEYSQTLAFESGLYKYVYPLRTGEKASRTLEDFTVSARLTSTQPIKNVYSPSHEVGISRRGDHEAVLGFEQEQALLDKDFVLYYGVSEKDFGLNLLSHATRSQDGFFMMMLAPRVELDDAMVMEKDITFVFDTSGSMSGPKIRQAREALEYCVRKLNPGDRFNVIRFSTDVELFKDTRVPATPQHVKAAVAFIQGFEARGGTAIDSALKAALAMPCDQARPSIMVFLTDGKPTIGESGTDLIAGHVSKANTGNTRVFVFGVGDKVNTHLLDRISGENGGLSQYVKPEEDIEVKVSTFSDKISNPVLANLRIEVDKITTKQLHPRRLPDLFAGDQLTVFGRYEEGGHVAVHLLGEVNGEDREFVYDATFHEDHADNAFIPRLWATRRIGYLLDEMRLHGEASELKDEVIALSREYGIMTPYTSYLVLENEKAYQDHGIPRPAPEPASPRPRKTPAVGEPLPLRAAAPAQWAESRRAIKGRGQVAADRAPASALSVPVFDDEAEVSDLAFSREAGKPGARRLVRAEKARISEYLGRPSGADAVKLSEATRAYRGADKAASGLETVRHVGRRVFLYTGDRWVDKAYKTSMKTTKVAFASEAYFALLAKLPELRRVFALGEHVTVVLADGTAVVVE